MPSLKLWFQWSTSKNRTVISLVTATIGFPETTNDVLDATYCFSHDEEVSGNDLCFTIRSHGDYYVFRKRPTIFLDTMHVPVSRRTTSFSERPIEMVASVVSGNFKRNVTTAPWFWLHPVASLDSETNTNQPSVTSQFHKRWYVLEEIKSGREKK